MREKRGDHRAIASLSFPITAAGRYPLQAAARPRSGNGSEANFDGSRSGEGSQSRPSLPVGAEPATLPLHRLSEKMQFRPSL